MIRCKHSLANCCIAVCLLLCVVLCAVSCGEEATAINFRTYQTYEDWQSADGHRVSIFGYMASADTAGQSVFQLVNAPYTHRPAVSEQSFFLDVHLKNGTLTDIVTTLAVKVEGKVELAPADQPFTDAFGYETQVRLVDATYTVAQPDELTGDAALWQSFAETGLVNNVMDAFNYAHFAIAWTDYTAKHEDGSHTYLTPNEAEASITQPGGEYYFGYVNNYFDRLCSRAVQIDAVRGEELSHILTALEAVSEQGLSSLRGGSYSQEPVSGEDILSGISGYRYVLDGAEELLSAYDALYARLTAWLLHFAL